MRKVFVTGIGTDVGKTIVSAVLTEAWEADYWKPLQAGTLEASDTYRVKRLISNPKTHFHPEAYRLKHPMSPHAAAELENIQIRSSKLKLPETENTLVIEGAGGIMVPYNYKGDTLVDMVEQWDAEVVLVVRNYLGSINHTLLSLAYLKEKGIKLLGIVYSGEKVESSERVIENATKVPVLGRINMEYDLSRDVIKEYAMEFVFI